MPSRLFLWSIISALAGFIFGFDTVVISGAESTIQDVWGLSSGMHGFAIGSALWGMVFGSLIGSWPTEKLGRQRTLLFIGILYFVSAVGSALAPDVTTFIIARVIGGIGVGISTIAAPLYISEIAPPERRGRLTGLFQFNIVFGILVAFLSNYLVGKYVEVNAWRWMLGIEAFPAIIYTVLCFTIPESPRWLIASRGERARGLAILGQIYPAKSPTELEAEADAIKASADSEIALAAGRAPSLLSPSLRRPVTLAFLIAFFNQMSGINAILYFAPRIFEKAGLGADAALLQSVGIGVTNLIFTFVGIYLIDRVGRRTLLTIGSLGYIGSLGLCAWAFSTETFGIVPACIFAFIASHAVGQGAVIWVFISEIFPARSRAAGQTLGCGTHWVLAALIGTSFPYFSEKYDPATIFWFFCAMMMLQLVWVIISVPETKGRTLEDLGTSL